MSQNQPPGPPQYSRRSRAQHSPQAPQMPHMAQTPQMTQPPQAPQVPGQPAERWQPQDPQGRRPVQPGQPVNGGRSESRASQPVPARLAQALAAARAWAQPASTGTRLIAFAIDLLVVFVIAALVWAATKSLLLGVLAVLEVVVILAFLDARRGITVGNLVMRIRTVRDDSPYSPGIARGFLRSLVLGAGSLVGIVGGFVVVATSSGDPMNMGRSWADRVGRTLVVRVPTRAEREAWEQGAEAWAANALVAPGANTRAAHNTTSGAARSQQAPLIAPGRMPHATQAPQTPLAHQVPQIHQAHQAPQGAQASQAQASQAQPSHLQAETLHDPRPNGHPQQPSHVPVESRQLRPVPVPQVERDGGDTGQTPPNTGLPTGVVSVESPVASPQPVRQVVEGEQLLLTFDTGQRVQLPLPLALNLGRRPEPTEADDQLCIVKDPDSSVSKTHLRLESRGESVWLTDLGSTNGSAVLDDTGEAMPLTAGARVRLEDGYRVKLGNRSFTVATVMGEMQI